MVYFIILILDAQFQNEGYGTEALKLILALLQEEARFDRVEVCVNREDAQARHVYERVGFVDSGYIDPDLPNCFNLVYHCVSFQSQMRQNCNKL